MRINWLNWPVTMVLMDGNIRCCHFICSATATTCFSRYNYLLLLPRLLFRTSTTTNTIVRIIVALLLDVRFINIEAPLSKPNTPASSSSPTSADSTASTPVASTDCDGLDYVEKMIHFVRYLTDAMHKAKPVTQPSLLCESERVCACVVCVHIVCVHARRVCIVCRGTGFTGSVV